jgi:hypothetical protein
VNDFWGGSFPDWLVGVGTLALAGLTFWSLRRFVAQEKQAQAEKKELQHQLNMQTLENISRKVEESELAALQRRRAQAEQIVAWTAVPEDGTRVYSDKAFDYKWGKDTAVWIQNDSSLPITNVVVGWFGPSSSAASDTRIIATVPPRSTYVYFRPSSLRGNGEMGVEIDFIDAHGVIWKRTRGGRVLEIGESTLEPNG